MTGEIIDPQDALALALVTVELTTERYEHDHNYETGCRDYEIIERRKPVDIAPELLVQLNANGWMLVKVDPFDTPTGTDLTNERLAELLDAFEEASEQYGYYASEGSPQESRDAKTAQWNARGILASAIRNGLAERLTSVGCCGGWVGPDGPEYCANCPRRGTATNAPTDRPALCVGCGPSGPDMCDTCPGHIGKVTLAADFEARVEYHGTGRNDL